MSAGSLVVLGITLGFAAGWLFFRQQIALLKDRNDNLKEALTEKFPGTQVQSATSNSDNKKIIKQIAALVDEGETIASIFIQKNNSDLIKTQYGVWVTKVDQYLRSELDASYAVQFRNASPYPYVQSGMASAGTGAWQHLKGNITALNGIITELRR